MSIREQEFPAGASAAEQWQFLLRYAILAPSIHNIQPWRFCVRDERTEVYLNCSAAVAPPPYVTLRELHISVGCAQENLLIAAEHFGFRHSTAYLPDAPDKPLVAVVTAEATGHLASSRPAGLFEMIPIRHTNRRICKPRSLDDLHLSQLRECCTEDDVFLQLIEATAVEQAIGHSPALYDLGQQPSSIVQNVLQKVGIGKLNKDRRQRDRELDVWRSASVFAVLGSAADDPQSQVRVGQVFERICLMATLLGIGVQPLSWPLQVAPLKEELTGLFGGKVGILQLPFCLGYVDWQENPTSRKPLDEVLAE